MKPYDTHATTDPFARSVSAFETLTCTLSGSDASAWTHTELEERLDAAGRELLRQLLQDHLDLRARLEEEEVRGSGGPPVTGPEGQVRPWRETGHSRWLASVFGLVRVTRVAHRGRGRGNVHPADVALSLPAGRHSMGLRRLAVTEAVRGSFDQAHDAVERRCGKVLGKRRLEELVVAAAVDVDDFYQTRIPVPCSREMPLVVQVDGKGVVMRPEALREATRRAAAKAATGHRGRLAPGEKPNRKGTCERVADSHRRGRGRLPPLDRRPPRHHRRPLGPARSRSRPATACHRLQRRPRPLLALPYRPRARAPLPQPAELRPHRLIATVTRNEPHPSMMPSRARGLVWRREPLTGSVECCLRARGSDSSALWLLRTAW